MSEMIQIRNEAEAMMILAGNRAFERFKGKTLAVVGSRRFRNKEYLEIWLSYLKPQRIVTGGAKGTDTLAEEFANEEGIPCDVHYPDLIRWPYHRFKGKAYLERNTLIASACDSMVAFLPMDEESRGTDDSIKKARVLGKPIIIIYFEVK